jgi:hypothetical protein
MTFGWAREGGKKIKKRHTHTVQGEGDVRGGREEEEEEKNPDP